MQKAEQAPQYISKHGIKKMVMLNIAEYEKLLKHKSQPNLVEFLQNSPLKGLELDLNRDNNPELDLKREIKF